MCGLVGVASTEKMRDKERRAGIFEELLILSAFRGWESTGVATIEIGKEKERPEYYKRALTAVEFIHTFYFGNQVVKRMDDYSIVMGHTRSATRGNICNRNAHPFQHGDITLTHNGTIENIHQLLPYDKGPTGVSVDSDKLAWLMNQEGPEEAIKKCEGAYALVWHDAKYGTLNFCKNDRKPLYFAFLKNENTMLWASEATALIHVCERRNIQIDDGIFYPKSHHIFTFNPTKLREYTDRPFVPVPRGGPPGRQSVTTLGDISKTGETFKNPPWSEGVRSLGDRSSIEHCVREAMKKDKLKNPGKPTKARKIQRADTELRAFGYKMDELAIVTPDSWFPYKNQKGRGLMTGHTKVGYPCIMHNVSTERYSLYVKNSRVWARVVNVVLVEKDKKAIVCIEHERYQEKFKEPNADKEELPQTNDSQSMERNLVGPDGTMVTLAKFRELALGGCGACDGFINPRDHEQLMWMGEPPAPICIDCQNNEDVMAMIGFLPRDPRIH